MNDIREQFPLLRRKINGKPLVYFDNAATSPKPQIVLDTLTNHYSLHNGNPGRGIHTLTVEATKIIDTARHSVSTFFDAPEGYTTIFTKNATDSFNLLAYDLEQRARKGEKFSLITTQTEHHANFLPWLRLSRDLGIQLKNVRISKSGEIDYTDLETKLADSPNPILAITACSNVTGIVTDLEKVSTLAKKYNAVTILDAAQLAPHKAISLTKTPFDYLVASAHKMYGLEGVGFLVGKKATLSVLEPKEVGGGIIEKVTEENYTLKTSEERLEAGTPNTAGIAGTVAALEFIREIGWEEIEKNEKTLSNYFIEKFGNLQRKFEKVRLLGESGPSRIPLFSFVSQFHPHDTADWLDRAGICVRAGHHCAQVIHNALGAQASTRVSLSFYNTTEEIDYFFDILEEFLTKFAD